MLEAFGRVPASTTAIGYTNWVSRGVAVTKGLFHVVKLCWQATRKVRTWLARCPRNCFDRIWLMKLDHDPNQSPSNGCFPAHLREYEALSIRASMRRKCSTPVETQRHKVIENTTERAADSLSTPITPPNAHPAKWRCLPPYPGYCIIIVIASRSPTPIGLVGIRDLDLR